MLEKWFRDGRALTHLKGIDLSLRRIANALEEKNLLGRNPGSGFHTLYEDPRSLADADLQNPTDEYFRNLELLEIQKQKNQGEASDLSDEEVEGVLSR